MHGACVAAALALLLSACGGGGSTSTGHEQTSSGPSTAKPSTMPAGGPAAQPASSPARDTPAAQSARAPLGVNLEGLWDWARLQPFVDLMKTSRPWGRVDAPWDENAPVDSEGWPTGDAGVVVNVRTFEPGDEDKRYRFMTPGVYELRFTGRATVGPSASTDVQVRNVVHDARSNTSTGEVVVGKAATQLMLTFTGTDGGVKDVSLRLPGYADDETFTTRFAEALEPFQVVRFMDFLRTNENPTQTWQQRTTPRSATQASAKGAAHEYAIQVANELGKDIWINVPAFADEAYVRSLALLLKQDLDPERAVYVEYSNELWNAQFSQTGANMKAAVAEALAGDTSLTNGTACTQAQFDSETGDCNPYWAGYNRVGKRTVDIARMFADVFGSGAMNKQVRVVYATQFANPGIAEQVLKNIATYRASPSSVLYGIATAPYFYLSTELAAASSAAKDEILQSLEGSLRQENEPMFAAGVKENGTFVRKAYAGGNFTGASHKALADFYGLKSLAYEGGPDFRQDTANRPAKVAANRDPRMGRMIRDGLQQWFGCGNDLFMYFSLSSPWDRYGYWGLTNDPTDLTGAKYVAAREMAQGARSAWNACR